MYKELGFRARSDRSSKRHAFNKEGRVRDPTWDRLWDKKDLYDIIYIYQMVRYIPGGQRGIRTLVTVSRKHAFQACAFSRSATCP